MVTALGLSVLIIGLDSPGIGHNLRIADANFVRSAHLGKVLLQGMLSLLLFVGASKSTLPASELSGGKSSHSP